MGRFHSTRTKIALLLAIGALIREVFAPFTGHPFDFELWIRLGYYTAQGLDPYRISAPIPNLSMPGAEFMTSLGYPPAWPFFLAGLYKLYALTGIDNRFFYYFILKQPMIISDLLDSVLIYKIVKQRSETNAMKALAFWLFCPFTILVSSVWGMFDQIVLVFVLLSLMWLSRTKTSAVTEAIGFLLKGIPLIYLPILAFVQKSRLKIVQYVLVFITISIFFTFLPYLVFPSWKISALLGTGTSDVIKVGNSMNYWVIVYVFLGLHVALPSWALELIKLWSYVWVPAVIVTSFFCVRIHRRKGRMNQRNLVLSMILVTLVFYLTKIQINEQYVIYFLGLGLIDYHWIASTKRVKEFYGIWISALGFLVANNSLLIRFLEPLSTYYRNLDSAIVSGVSNEFRLAALTITAISFSIFCFLYLRSVFFELKTSHFQDAAIN